MDDILCWDTLEQQLKFNAATWLRKKQSQECAINYKLVHTHLPLGSFQWNKAQSLSMDPNSHQTFQNQYGMSVAESRPNNPYVHVHQTNSKKSAVKHSTLFSWANPQATAYGWLNSITALTFLHNMSTNEMMVHCRR
jgi:hypothetical protein